MTDISRDMVEHLCHIHRGYEQHGTISMLLALRAALDAAEAEIRSSAGSHQKALAQKNNHIVQLMAEKDAAEADKRQAVDAEQDRILGLIDDRFSGALSLRDEARKHGDTTGAMVRNEAVQQMAELRAAIREGVKP